MPTTSFVVVLFAGNPAIKKPEAQFNSGFCMERRPTARFAELNGRDAERAATLAYDRFELFPS